MEASGLIGDAVSRDLLGEIFRRQVLKEDRSEESFFFVLNLFEFAFLEKQLSKCHCLCEKMPR